MCKMDSFRSSHVSRRSKFDRTNASVLLLLLLLVVVPPEVNDDADGFPSNSSWDAAVANSMTPVASAFEEWAVAAGNIDSDG